MAILAGWLACIRVLFVYIKLLFVMCLLRSCICVHTHERARSSDFVYVYVCVCVSQSKYFFRYHWCSLSERVLVQCMSSETHVTKREKIIL